MSLVSLVVDEGNLYLFSCGANKHALVLFFFNFMQFWDKNGHNNRVSARTLALAPQSGKSWIHPRHGIPISQTWNPCFLLVYGILFIHFIIILFIHPRFVWYGVMVPSLHPWSPRLTIYWLIQRDVHLPLSQIYFTFM